MTNEKNTAQKQSKKKKNTNSIRLEMNLYITGISACVLSQFSFVRFFVTLWNIPHQAPLSMGFPQARILEQAAISFSRGSSDPGIKPTSLNICIGRLVLYHQCHLGSYFYISNNLKWDVAQRLKCLPGMRETQIRSLGWEDPLEKGMATHSSIHAQRIPWTGEPGWLLQSIGSKRVRHN